MKHFVEWLCAQLPAFITPQPLRRETSQSGNRRVVSIGVTLHRMTTDQAAALVMALDGLPAMPAHATTMLYATTPGMFEEGHVPPEAAQEVEVLYPTNTTVAKFPGVYRVRIAAQPGGGAAPSDTPADPHFYIGNSNNMPTRFNEHYYGAPTGSVGIRTCAKLLPLRHLGCTVQYEFAVLTAYAELPQHIKHAFQACRDRARRRRRWRPSSLRLRAWRRPTCSQFWPSPSLPAAASTTADAHSAALDPAAWAQGRTAPRRWNVRAR